MQGSPWQRQLSMMPAFTFALIDIQLLLLLVIRIISTAAAAIAVAVTVGICKSPSSYLAAASQPGQSRRR